MVVGGAWAKKGRDVEVSWTLASRCQLCSPPGLPWNGTGGLWAMGDRMGQMVGHVGGGVRRPGVSMAGFDGV